MTFAPLLRWLGAWCAVAVLVACLWVWPARRQRTARRRHLAALPPLPTSWHPVRPPYRSRRYVTTRREA